MSQEQAMGEPTPSIRDTRADQMFLQLTPAQVDRLRRFGEIRRYAEGDAVVQVGETGHGLYVVLSGAIEVGERAGDPHIATSSLRTGNFQVELGQLSGRPALVDAYALEETETMAIPPHRLRALLAAEAVVGE